MSDYPPSPEQHPNDEYESGRYRNAFALTRDGMLHTSLKTALLQLMNTHLAYRNRSG